MVKINKYVDRFYALSGNEFYVIMDKQSGKAVVHVNYIDLPEGMAYGKHAEMLLKQINEDRLLYMDVIEDYINDK